MQILSHFLLHFTRVSTPFVVTNFPTIVKVGISLNGQPGTGGLTIDTPTEISRLEKFEPYNCHGI